MKKLFRTVMVLSMASLAVFTSCKKDDKADVADATIDINAKVGSSAINDGDFVPAGTAVKFTIVSTGNSDNKLKSITVTSDANSTPILSQKSLSGTSSTDTASFIPSTPGSVVSVTVSLNSEKGTVTKSFKITVPRVTEASPGEIPLFAQLNGTDGHFMDLSNLSLYGTNTAQANLSKIDLGCFYGNTKHFTLAGPQDNDLHTLFSGLNWTGARTTLIAKTSLTKTDFDAIKATGNEIALANLGATASYSSAANDLATGNVLLYKNQDGLMGLIYVVSHVGSSGNDGIINVEIVYAHN
jgi:uncharacterized protein YjbI with pentapeptide repeats